MENPFDKYKIQVVDHYIESLGATVKLRELTLKQSQEFMDKAVKGVDKDDNPIVDVKAIQEARFGKVSAALVEPAMSVAQLKALGTKAKEAIAEILNIVDPLPVEENSQNSQT